MCCYKTGWKVHYVEEWIPANRGLAKRVYGVVLEFMTVKVQLVGLPFWTSALTGRAVR